MLDKLRSVELRWQEVRARLEDPAVYGDSGLLRRLRQEEKELAPVAAAAAEYRRAQGDLDSARALLSDPELREIGRAHV